jgi:hypothetical protein
VHSSNPSVTRSGSLWFAADVTTMFHIQVIDLESNCFVGTFFTNLSKAPVFTGLRRRADIASTDLSTARVDKGESPFTSDSYVT